MGKEAHLIFDNKAYLERRKRAMLNAALLPKNPWFLHEFAASGLVENIAPIKRDFNDVLEIFSLNGELMRYLKAENLLGADKKIKSITQFEPAMAKNTDFDCLSLMDELPVIGCENGKKWDMILSASGFNFINDLPGMLAKIRASLNEDGVFMASFIANKSLQELRDAFMNCEIDEFGGAGMRVSPMVETEAAVNLLSRAGFKMPVSSCESLKVRYDNVFALFRDIKGMGENAAFYSKNGKRLNRRFIAKVADYYQSNFQDPDGRVYATFDIVTLCGWA